VARLRSLLTLSFLLTGCLNHFVYHPKKDPPGVTSWSEQAARLRELGREVELVTITDAGHVFNFRDRNKASAAWNATLRWLDSHLESTLKGAAAGAAKPATGAAKPAG
jgi:hypothetical protein